MTDEPFTHDFDRNPAAVAWARAKVQAEIQRAERFVEQATAEGASESADRWRHYALHLTRTFIGQGGCVIGAFDERRPGYLERLDAEPTVREAAADDRRWPLEKAGE